MAEATVINIKLGIVIGRKDGFSIFKVIKIFKMFAVH